MKAAVTVQNLTFSYDDVNVLENICFTIETGDFVGVIGPNGGGKTTLLKLLLGFFKPKKGLIKLFGDSPQSAYEKISYVPQKINFDKQFPISVMEVVLMGRLSRLPWYGRYGKLDCEAALAALEKVGLADLSSRQFGSLSSGQAQRVYIARALVSDPKLLLLDEPTASVDAESDRNIRKILQGLNQQLTIIMVTHNLEAIIRDVQKVICVERTVSFLDPKEVCEHYAYGLYHPPLVQVQKEDR